MLNLEGAPGERLDRLLADRDVTTDSSITAVTQADGTKLRVGDPMGDGLVVGFSRKVGNAIIAVVYTEGLPFHLIDDCTVLSPSGLV